MAVSPQGSLTLINATPYTWQNALNESNNMVEWDSAFPSSVPPGSILPIAVEFTSGPQPSGSGSVIYAFTGADGSEFEFGFQASSTSGPQITVNYSAGSSFGNPRGSTFDMEWSSDPGAPFVLSGFQNTQDFESTNAPANWMQQNLPTIGCQPLRRLCMPGSHDAGMSTLNGNTLLSNDMDTLAQWVDIAVQLDAGYRYFDIRPVIHDGSFYTGHYSEVGKSWLGGNGQDIASIITQVNSFLSANNELVILDLSHMYNTDAGYRTLNAGEFTNLVNQLKGLQHLFANPSGAKDLSTLPLNSFIANGPAVIVLLSDTSVSLPSPPPVGFYTDSSYSIFNEYANTPLLPMMTSDQLSKMAAQRTSPDSGLFLLSWTLTTIGDIRSLANMAHNALFDPSSGGLWNTIYSNKKSYPNIIMIDGIGAAPPSVIDDRNVAALSMAINHAVLLDVACP